MKSYSKPQCFQNRSCRLSHSGLILDLHQAGCQVTGLHQRDETLESYYMNLVGGGRDV